MDTTLAALADPTRRELLRRLAHTPCRASMLATGFAISRPAICKHTRLLKKAGLIRAKKNGREQIYELAPTGGEGPGIPTGLFSWDSWVRERNFRTERGLAMRLTSAVKKVEQHLTRVLVVGELRISTSDQCSRCGSRRKTLVASLGWICTACFDRCKEEAEKLVVERNAVHRIPEAYERAIRSYSELNLT